MADDEEGFFSADDDLDDDLNDLLNEVTPKEDKISTKSHAAQVKAAAVERQKQRKKQTQPERKKQAAPKRSEESKIQCNEERLRSALLAPMGVLHGGAGVDSSKSSKQTTESKASPTEFSTSANLDDDDLDDMFDDLVSGGSKAPSTKPPVTKAKGKSAAGALLDDDDMDDLFDDLLDDAPAPAPAPKPKANKASKAPVRRAPAPRAPQGMPGGMNPMAMAMQMMQQMGNRSGAGGGMGMGQPGRRGTPPMDVKDALRCLPLHMRKEWEEQINKDVRRQREQGVGRIRWPKSRAYAAGGRGQKQDKKKMGPTSDSGISTMATDEAQADGQQTTKEEKKTVEGLLKGVLQRTFAETNVLPSTAHRRASPMPQHVIDSYAVLLKKEIAKMPLSTDDVLDEPERFKNLIAIRAGK